MVRRRFIPALALCCVCSASLAVDDSQRDNERDEESRGWGWEADSRLQAEQWVGSWLISRDGEARHVWSLSADGRGRSYAFTEEDGKLRFAYGYDIRWYFDPFTQMANIKTERRIVCRDGKVYPYFLTLKSYESDYAVKGKFAWQTTWTEASIGDNHLHKSLVVFVAPLSGWHNPRKDSPCPEFPSLQLEQDIDAALTSWEEGEAGDEIIVDTTPAPGEPEFEGEEFKSSRPAVDDKRTEKSSNQRKQEDRSQRKKPQ